MEKKRHKAYVPLLALSGLFAAAAVATLVPNPKASWDNVLGYRSLCTFAPIATAICAFLAGTTCVIRARIFGPQAGYRKPWRLPLVLGLLILATLVFSVPAYIQVKTDALSGATLERSEK